MNDYLATTAFFFTPDLSLPAYLVTIGFTLDHLDKSNKSKVVFAFARVAGLDDAIQTFWSDAQASVSPLQYFNAIKMLKNRIYSE